MDEDDESVSLHLALSRNSKIDPLLPQSHATTKGLLSPLPPPERRSGTFRDRRAHRRSKFETDGSRQVVGGDHSKGRESSHLLGLHDDVEHLGGFHATSKLQM